MTKEELFLKNHILGQEFDRYMIEHPEFLEKIPQDARLVLLPQDDPELCKENLNIAEKARETDDKKDRPLVYVRIEKIAPIRSRLISLKLEKVAT